MGRALLQSERNATLFIDVLRSNVKLGKFRVHDFVVMPDHVHLLISVDRSISIEKAVQLIKGGFSYRVKKEHGYLGEVWQRGFSDVRADWLSRRENSRTASHICRRKKQQGLKPRKQKECPTARLKSCPDTNRYSCRGPKRGS